MTCLKARKMYVAITNWAARANLQQLKHVVDLLPQNVMTLIFHVYCSQELYQATDDTYQALAELETIFPSSAFLKTQRALLYYHSKGSPIRQLLLGC